jgi:hypothetical protein
MEIMKAVLGLEDGQYVVGEGFGVEGEVSGELVFNTQMTGYMESLTDPSYFGQILMFTFPLIGNYGVDTQNFQNPNVCALGCITKEICEKPGHFLKNTSFMDLPVLTPVHLPSRPVFTAQCGRRSSSGVKMESMQFSSQKRHRTFLISPPFLRFPVKNPTISMERENGSQSSISV